MEVFEERTHNRILTDSSALPASTKRLQIAFCLPELHLMQQAMRGEGAEAAYIQQKYIADGLIERGHSLEFVAPLNYHQIVCTSDLERPKAAPQTWSSSRWFDYSSKVAWQVQRRLRVPYLNLFSNYSFMDACLRCLPGHDLVYERNNLYGAGVAMACQRLGLPYVMFFDADQIAEHEYMGKPITGLLGWRARSLLNYNLQAADCIICVSAPAKAHLVANWRVPADKIVVFPNVADVQRFRPDAAASADVRASMGVGANPLLIFVGNFYEWHDVATLLDAFAQVLKASPEAHLVLVGDGSQRPAMMQHASDLGLEDAVTFTGLVAHDEVPRFLSAADIAIAPYPAMESDLWLSPLKLFEYMASGTAVVASASGQLTQVIENGRNGLLVPPGDAEALAEAMGRLIGDPVLRFELGQQAREDAERNHSWEHYLSRLERLFSAVIDGRPVSQI